MSPLFHPPAEPAPEREPASWCLVVNLESNAAQWWTAARACSTCPPSLLPLLAVGGPTEVGVPDDELTQALDWCAALPGWDAEPLLVRAFGTGEAAPADARDGVCPYGYCPADGAPSAAQVEKCNACPESCAFAGDEPDEPMPASDEAPAGEGGRP